MKKLILIALLIISTNAIADNPKYMKLQEDVGGGYFTIFPEPCEIAIFVEKYPNKGLIETGGEVRRACWTRAESHWNDRFVSQVLAVEEITLEDGKLFYPLHSFGQYYFLDEK